MHDHPCPVAVLSPHQIAAAGITTMLARYPELVTPVAHAPDVVLYDVLGLLGGDDSQLVGVLASSAATVIALTHNARPDLAARALALGASGTLPMSLDDAALLSGVASACEGRTAPAGVPGVAARERRVARLAGLTQRELDVLMLIAGGLSNQEIAEKSFLSINSVKTYIRTAYRKIDVVSRSQAVLWCFRHGVVPLP